MRILILGGTQFIGRYFAILATKHGHDVTVFSRGSRPAPEGITKEIIGDRNTDLAKLRGQTWDAVVDTSAYIPRHVRDAARELRNTVERYLFVSTVSIYANDDVSGNDEDSALIRLEDPTTEQVSDATYGGLKVLCEEALEEVYPPSKRLIIRPGIVVGPGDWTDRFTYWPVRLARGGEVLAPNDPKQPVQWIDVRDLVEFMLIELEQEGDSAYNIVNDAGRYNMGDLLLAAKNITGSSSEISWVGDEFLLNNAVRPSADLPFWLPGSRSNFFMMDGSKAYARGLRPRSLESSIRDTFEWQLQRGNPPLKVGLSPSREAELLRLWREQDHDPTKLAG